MSSTTPPKNLQETPTDHGASNSTLSLLVLTTLGVVFGDIGTSPLYALRVCFSGAFGVSLSQDNILGVLSLILWSLIVVISVKYLGFVMRADNQGEGGIMVLTGLILPERNHRTGRSVRFLIGIGLFGAALFFGDGMITPAISVLSAIEGLGVAAPALSFAVKPLAIVVLIGLFSIQSRGTARVGRLFGPVMLVWFTVLAVLGLRSIVAAPAVLAAVNPVFGFRFLVTNSLPGFLVLGAVFLVVTGGEALYADMGHFGKRPIRIAWFAVVLPGLLLNYFGQGALLLRNVAAIESPFYILAPSWAVYPLVLLSTAATIIASQAVISGSFSLARQAVQLGYSPRLVIRHTSPAQIGQIYVPAVNWTLMVATIALVLGFGSSDNMASAYGVAVTTTM
ncbi:MAG: KUP/HAK/KT family potassium transporter, partial [Acidobacteriota bacterium]